MHAKRFRGRCRLTRTFGPYHRALFSVFGRTASCSRAAAAAIFPFLFARSLVFGQSSTPAAITGCSLPAGPRCPRLDHEYRQPFIRQTRGGAAAVLCASAIPLDVPAGGLSVLPLCGSHAAPWFLAKRTVDRPCRDAALLAVFLEADPQLRAPLRKVPERRGGGLPACLLRERGRGDLPVHERVQAGLVFRALGGLHDPGARASEARGAREWVRITLVILLIAGPVVAIAPSRPKPTDQAILFRGAAGDANTMGHVTSLALLALILIRERLGPNHPLRALSLIALIVLGGLLLATKARSSAFSVAVGLYVALAYLPRLRHTLVGVVVLGTIALVAVGSLEDTVKGFIFKARVSSLAAEEEHGGLENAWGKIFATRIPQWERAWQAFWKRPMLGWGFGASETTPPEWKFSFQAVGRLEEVNNDLLQVAEGVGFIGLVFHVALILMVLIEGRPPRGCKNFEWIAVYCLSWALWANFMFEWPARR